jgi:hypothetical protein
MCKSVYQSTSGRLSCGRTESSYFPSPSTNWPTTSRISPPARTPNPTRPAQASLLDLLDYVPRFPAPARPAPPRPQLYPAHYAASCTRRTPTTAGAPRTQDVLRNLRTQPIPPTSRNGTTHGTLRGLRSHGLVTFPSRRNMVTVSTTTTTDRGGAMIAFTVLIEAIVVTLSVQNSLPVVMTTRAIFVFLRLNIMLVAGIRRLLVVQTPATLLTL